jgi:hypothetical protein
MTGNREYVGTHRRPAAEFDALVAAGRASRLKDGGAHLSAALGLETLRRSRAAAPEPSVSDQKAMPALAQEEEDGGGGGQGGRQRRRSRGKRGRAVKGGKQRWRSKGKRRGAIKVRQWRRRQGKQWSRSRGKRRRAVKGGR